MAGAQVRVRRMREPLPRIFLRVASKPLGPSPLLSVTSDTRVTSRVYHVCHTLPVSPTARVFSLFFLFQLTTIPNSYPGAQTGPTPSSPVRYSFGFQSRSHRNNPRGQARQSEAPIRPFSAVHFRLHPPPQQRI